MAGSGGTVRTSELISDGAIAILARQVSAHPAAAAAVVWLAIVALLAAIGPLIANGHPLLLREVDASGRAIRTSSPLLSHLGPLDLALGAMFLIGLPLLVAPARGTRLARLGGLLYAAALASGIVITSELIQGLRNPGSSDSTAGPWVSAIVIAIPVFVLACRVRFIASPRPRIALAAIGCAIAVVSIAITPSRPPLESFGYSAKEQQGTARATYTLIPLSPNQRHSELDRRPPFARAPSVAAATTSARGTFLLGTDGFGQDVLSQLIWAARLAITIGLVSTGIAVLIGVSLGAVMGYFGGWIDLLLYRFVEVVMAVPLLFLLVAAAAVLPAPLRTTATMMAIIGCFTWTGAARFTRAEFLKVRNQDFVLAARASGLPVSSVLFRHILPNAITPVLVDASFAIGAAIAIEATLSFLGLGPVDQASWGRLLAGAVSSDGRFSWWLAVFPGLMIFLTVLSYNLIGEALRDAADPKLRSQAQPVAAVP